MYQIFYDTEKIQIVQNGPVVINTRSVIIVERDVRAAILERTYHALIEIHNVELHSLPSVIMIRGRTPI